jgi:hypothetical protein
MLVKVLNDGSQRQEKSWRTQTEGAHEMTVDFCTMFYVPDAEEAGVNLQAPLEERIAVYIRCACNLASMMGASERPLTLITNDKKKVLSSSAYAKSFPIVEMDFTLDVPRGIPFRSAHFKLDVIAALGTGRFGTRPALIDLDMLAIQPISDDLLTSEGFLAYDITSAMIAEVGEAKLLRDINILTDHPRDRPIWFGGEFLLANHDDFAELSKEILRIWPNYLKNIETFSHIGDETVVTAALLNLMNMSKPIRDAGQAGVVQRWWSARTHFPQKRLHEMSETCFLHLPADKVFFASLDAHFGMDALAEYKRFVRSRLLIRRAINPFLNISRVEKKYAGRL